MVLGFSAQWTDPLPGAPFRYGGAVRPAGLATAVEEAVGEAAAGIAEAFGLVGLNSVDFLVGSEGWYLIEVNPRPGATLDVFGPRQGSLLGLHVEASKGRVPAEKPSFSAAAAARIVYARRGLNSVPQCSWPDWTADRQPPGSRVDCGAPLCTVLATAQTPQQARRLVEQRAHSIRVALGAD
jgi:predicted ATP-grasp superfamily ATP-dependent carboligase